MHRRCRSTLVALCVLLAPSSRARAEPGPPASEITPNARALPEDTTRAQLLRWGDASYFAGDYDAAAAAFATAHAERATAYSFWGLGRVACASHNYHSCERLLERALTSHDEPLDAVTSSEAIALLVHARGVVRREPALATVPLVHLGGAPGPVLRREPAFWWSLALTAVSSALGVWLATGLRE